MEIRTTQVFVGSGDSPDDREAVFAMGHVSKADFAAAAKCTENDVKHVWAHMEDEEGGPDFAFWNTKRKDPCVTPVTMAFT